MLWFFGIKGFKGEGVGLLLFLFFVQFGVEGGGDCGVGDWLVFKDKWSNFDLMGLECVVKVVCELEYLCECGGVGGVGQGFFCVELVCGCLGLCVYWVCSFFVV